MAPLPPRDQRYPWLKYQVEGYTKDIMHKYEQTLEMIFGRKQAPEKVNDVDLFYFRSMDRGNANVPHLLAYDSWVWVAPRPERQPNAMADAPEAAEDATTVDEGAQADPAPVQAPQPPHAAPRSKPQRILRLKGEVHEL
nr:hypothetical protein [Tanacetum cinerariifolium]